MDGSEYKIVHEVTKTGRGGRGESKKEERKKRTGLSETRCDS